MLLSSRIEMKRIPIQKRYILFFLLLPLSSFYGANEGAFLKSFSNIFSSSIYDGLHAKNLE